MFFLYNNSIILKNSVYILLYKRLFSYIETLIVGKSSTADKINCYYPSLKQLLFRFGLQRYTLNLYNRDFFEKKLRKSHFMEIFPDFQAKKSNRASYPK